MKILSFNVNGLRGICKKGFLNFFEKSKPDIFCLQEIKAQREQLSSDLLKPKGYHAYFNFAKRKGYSGVLVYTKEKPLKIKRKIGFKKFDSEGRFLKLKYPSFTIINLYLPHGGRGKEKLDYKLKAYEYLFSYLKKEENQNLILVGDFNIAHKEIDLARPKQNKENIMFTLEEREQINKLLKLGFVDSFRKFYKKGGHYTWWPYGFQARERNIGWRIDYCFVSEKLAPKLKKSFVLPEIYGSDHCPIGVEIEF